MNRLLELSLHGSVVFVLVCGLDRLLTGFMSAAGRRLWWSLVPVSFLLTFTLPVLPPPTGGSLISATSAWSPPIVAVRAFTGEIEHAGPVWIWFWLAGMFIYLALVAVQTLMAHRRWSRERLSTDSVLLALLEDSKEESGITAPIGLVVTEYIGAPAIMGWLRPRMLLPRAMTTVLSPAELRAVCFHELAHFRSLDIPLGWLFTLARGIHWWNPLVHVAYDRWAHFREEAADADAMMLIKKYPSVSYGETLLRAIRGNQGGQAPFGALAIGESIHQLTRRIIMINHAQNNPPRFLLAAVVTAILVLGFIARPGHAQDATDPKAVAQGAMQTWLAEIDDHHYEQSWSDASAFFQKAITSDKWTAALESVRTPLGKCTSRQLASALPQGDMVIAQFNSSFENLAYAVETVTFQKASDGTWKAAGYYIKPKI